MLFYTYYRADYRRRNQQDDNYIYNTHIIVPIKEARIFTINAAIHATVH